MTTESKANQNFRARFIPFVTPASNPIYPGMNFFSAGLSPLAQRLWRRTTLCCGAALAGEPDKAGMGGKGRKITSGRQTTLAGKKKGTARCSSPSGQLSGQARLKVTPQFCRSGPNRAARDRRRIMTRMACGIGFRFQVGPVSSTIAIYLTVR
jgi:hypothetical protein